MNKSVVKILMVSIVGTLLWSCVEQKKQGVEKADIPFNAAFKCTPVKDQGMTEDCWLYAFLACIETERMEHYNDSVNLSPRWLMRSLLMEQANEMYLSQGALPVCVRGIGPEAERLMRQYGIVPWDAYCPDSINTRDLQEWIGNEVSYAIENRKRLNALDKRVDKVLPVIPKEIRNGLSLNGTLYTYKQFGDSLLSGINVRWLTSYNHHPYGEPFVIELPDNFRRHAVMNVEIDDFYSQVVHALQERHPVFWEGKMPENKDLNLDKNVALHRQQALELFQTTDQHSMAIVGLKQEGNDESFFICKNSWGRGWGVDGFCLMSKEEFLINTILVGIFGK